LWTTLIGTATKEELKDYISNSKVCQSKVLPAIVRDKVKEYEKNKSNEIRSVRTLYEGGLLSKKEYTAKRNCADNIKDDPDTAGSNEFMPGCEISNINSIDHRHQFLIW
jgi:competence protein ComGC